MTSIFPMTSKTSWDRILCLRECNKINPKVVALCISLARYPSFAPALSHSLWVRETSVGFLHLPAQKKSFSILLKLSVFFNLSVFLRLARSLFHTLPFSLPFTQPFLQHLRKVSFHGCKHSQKKRSRVDLQPINRARASESLPQ